MKFATLWVPSAMPVNYWQNPRRSVKVINAFSTLSPIIHGELIKLLRMSFKYQSEKPLNRNLFRWIDGCKTFCKLTYRRTFKRTWGKKYRSSMNTLQLLYASIKVNCNKSSPTCWTMPYDMSTFQPLNPL